MPLHCPRYDGHGNLAAYESFSATITIEVFSRTFPGTPWTILDRSKFENAALEFGGAYWEPSSTYGS